MQRVKWAVLGSGFIAVIAQTLIIREALALFSGNELVSGIMLSLWLVFGGIGSLVFSCIGLKYDPRKVFAYMLLILCFLLVFSLCFLRVAPRIFGLPLGEIIDLHRIMIISVLTLAPTCMVFGALFPAASRIFTPERVYFLEGLGAFSGGIIITFLLVRVLPPFGIMLISVVVLGCLVIWIGQRIRLLFLPLLLLLGLLWMDRIEFFFRRTQMSGQNLVGLDESRYGVIAVTESGGQYNFFTNGLYDFSYPDLYTSEEAVHYALLLHAEPRSILLVGGGIGNSISQVLEHPSIDGVTYVELDPLLFSMGELYLGEDLGSQEKLTVHFGDARYYVRNAPRQYDVIIVNLPDPANAQINRFYTSEFFAEAKDILNPHGLLSVRITAPPNIISPIFGQLLNTIYRSLNSSYSNIIALPTSKVTFIASEHKIETTGIADTLSARINARNLDLTYVNPYYFGYELSQEKLDYLNGRIAESEGYVNRDLKPVCYYFASILWGGILSETLRKGFIEFFGLPPVFFFLPLLLVFFFYRRKSLVYVSVLAVGASEISAEVILIVLFQVFYGYIYGWIGAIIAAYMLGLAIGTLGFLKVPFLKRRPILTLARVEFVMAVYFVIVIAVALTEPPLVNVIIPLLVFGGGLMGGLHFPLSISIISREKAGYVYGIDLVGSSLGALVTAMVLIPVLGIVFTLAIFGIMNLLVGVGLNFMRGDL
jgi:spermidine synthase